MESVEDGEPCFPCEAPPNTTDRVCPCHSPHGEGAQLGTRLSPITRYPPQKPASCWPGLPSRATGEFWLPMMSSLYKNPENGVKFTDTCCCESEEKTVDPPAPAGHVPMATGSGWQRFTLRSHCVTRSGREHTLLPLTTARGTTLPSQGTQGVEGGGTGALGCTLAAMWGPWLLLLLGKREAARDWLHPSPGGRSGRGKPEAAGGLLGGVPPAGWSQGKVSTGGCAAQQLLVARRRGAKMKRTP